MGIQGTHLRFHVGSVLIVLKHDRLDVERRIELGRRTASHSAEIRRKSARGRHCRGGAPEVI